MRRCHANDVQDKASEVLHLSYGRQDVGSEPEALLVDAIAGGTFVGAVHSAQRSEQFSK